MAYTQLESLRCDVKRFPKMGFQIPNTSTNDASSAFYVHPHRHSVQIDFHCVLKKRRIFYLNSTDDGFKNVALCEKSSQKCKKYIP